MAKNSVKRNVKRNKAGQPEIESFEGLVGGHILLERLAKRANTVAVFSLIVAALAILLAVVGFSTTPEPKYFLADAEGRVVSLPPVSKPLEDPSRLTKWFSNVVTESFTLNFATYNQQLGKVRKYYTAAGYEKLLNALRQSGIAAMLKKGRYLIVATPIDAPIITREFTASSVAGYVIKQHILLTFYLPNGQPVTNKYTVEGIVLRVPPEVSYYGVQVDRLIMSKGIK